MISGSGLVGDCWPLLALTWLSPLVDSIRSLAPGRSESRPAGPRDNDDDLLAWFPDPFIVPAIDGRGAFEAEEDKDGGPIEVRLVFEGGSIDFRAVLDGVPVLEEVPDEAVDPSCFVGDLLGDLKKSACSLDCQLLGDAYRQSRNPRSRRGARGIDALSLPGLRV